jgi:site-specific DNA-methyltransferase (adenine-specific)/modification methylase
MPLDLGLLWQQYVRVVKPSGVIVLTGQGLFTARLILSNPDMFRYKITWIKSKATNFLNVRKQPLRKHEDICVFYKGVATYNPQMAQGLPYDRGTRSGSTESYNRFDSTHVHNISGVRHPADIIYFKTAEAEGKVYHATQKPVELGRYLVRTYSNEGEIVLDNTCGSGSFLVAAALEGRQFIGIEKNMLVYKSKNRPPDLVNVCKRRVAVAMNQSF